MTTKTNQYSQVNKNASTDPVGGRYDNHLQSSKVNRVEALDVTLRITGLLYSKMFHHSD